MNTHARHQNASNTMPGCISLRGTVPKSLTTKRTLRIAPPSTTHPKSTLNSLTHLEPECPITRQRRMKSRTEDALATRATRPDQCIRIVPHTKATSLRHRVVHPSSTRNAAITTHRNYSSSTPPFDQSLHSLPHELLHEIAYFLPSPAQVITLAHCCTHFYSAFLYNNSSDSFWNHYFHSTLPLRVSPLGIVDSLAKYKVWQKNKATFHTSHVKVSSVRFSPDASRVSVPTHEKAIFYLPVRSRYSIPKEGTWEATFVFKSNNINMTHWPGVGLVTKQVMYNSTDEDDSANLSRNVFISPPQEMLYGGIHCGLYTPNSTSLSLQNLGYFSNGTVCRMDRVVWSAREFASNHSITMRVTPTYSLQGDHADCIEESLQCASPELCREHPFIGGVSSDVLKDVILGTKEEREAGRGLVEFFVNGHIAFRCYHVLPQEDDYDSNPLIAVCNVPAGCSVDIASCRYWAKPLEGITKRRKKDFNAK